MRRRDWVETQGRIGSVHVDGIGEGRSVSVVFTYQVDGHIYGGTYTAKPWQSTPVVGNMISLKYDPDEPDRNDLVVSETRWKWVVWLAVAVFVLAELLSILRK